MVTKHKKGKQDTIIEQNKIEFEDMNEALKAIKKQKENPKQAKRKKMQEQEEVYLFEKEKIHKTKTKKTVKEEIKKQATKKQLPKKEQIKSKKVVEKVQQPKKKKENIEEVQRKRKRVYKIIKYSILTILILIAIIATLYSPIFNIEKIEVKGNQKITTEEIIALSQIPLGESTFKISKSKVIDKLKQNTYIDSVEIKRKLPNEVVVTVKERNTTFMLEYGGGYVYLNNQGYMLEISTQKLEVPILQGGETLEGDIKVGNRVCKEDLIKIARVLKIMESAGNIGIESLISRIDVSIKENYKLIFDTELKTAHIGDESNLSTKMLYVKALLEDNKTIAGEIYVNMDLNKANPFFRKQV